MSLVQPTLADPDSRAGSPRSRPVTIVDRLCALARSRAECTAFLFCDDGMDVRRLRYGELFTRSAAVARELPARGQVGARVLVTAHSNEAFVIAFRACLLAGAVAVPTPEPWPGPLATRLRGIARDCGARSVLADNGDVP